MNKLQCSLYRGGTSKAIMIAGNKFKNNIENLEKILPAMMGSPHARQIDGIGNGDSLCSKVAIVSKSNRLGIDLDYFFVQVMIGEPSINTAITCGNIASAVLPFALNEGMIECHKNCNSKTAVIYSENTGIIIKSSVRVENGEYCHRGDFKIDGVNNYGSAVKLDFMNPAGSKTGKMLPTGNVLDRIDGIEVSCLDVSAPMVILRANDLGKTGYEKKSVLDNDRNFMQRLEVLRGKASKIMGFRDVSSSIIPKICLVSAPKSGGNICSRYFTPFDCHAAYSVSAGMCLAAATIIDGTVANSVATTNDNNHTIHIEHLSGKLSVCLDIEKNGRDINIKSCGFFRTARQIFSGEVYLP